MKKDNRKQGKKKSKENTAAVQTAAAEGRPAAAGGKKKYPAWFYLIIILLPLLMLTLLEMSLRVFNYGLNLTQWVELDEKSLILNPDIARRYFYTTQNVPYSNQTLFDKVKAPNSFRVFVLGESSAAGYPFLPNGSFSKYLRKRLELNYPHKRIEMVNVAMTAINTYALRDMMKGIVEQKPDLILIYTGHNEYYGALGVGSMESLGKSRHIVNFVLWLNKFKTVELLRNTIRKVTSSFSSSSANDNASGTLMSRMAKEQLIPYGSDIYRQGLEQFEGNMRDILDMAKDNNIPVVLGTLASNLKDQKPFVSVKDSNEKPAMDVFLSAQKTLQQGDREGALKLFRKAKDLDALRFRAPEEMNAIIRRLAKEYSYPVADIDGAVNSSGPDGIAGDNIMTDHLHPTLEGYQLLGSVFFRTMLQNGLLPGKPSAALDDAQQDSAVKKSFLFTRIDSVIGRYRIAVLKNDWPFVKVRRNEEILFPQDFIDSLAYDVIMRNGSWEEAHRNTAGYYINHSMFDEFQREMDLLIEQFPFMDSYYEKTSEILVLRKQFDRALKYLYMMHARKNDAYSSKWIGIIQLSHKNYVEAYKYLKKSSELDSSDPQTWYNLSGIYINRNEYAKAMEAVERCLGISPNFPGAQGLRARLTEAIK